VIIVSSKSQATDKAWGARQGARNYLTKPLDHRLLIRAVDGLLPR